MNTMMKCTPDVRSIEIDMNIRERHEHNDEIYAGH